MLYTHAECRVRSLEHRSGSWVRLLGLNLTLALAVPLSLPLSLSLSWPLSLSQFFFQSQSQSQFPSQFRCWFVFLFRFLFRPRYMLELGLCSLDADLHNVPWLFQAFDGELERGATSRLGLDGDIATHLLG